MFDDEKSVLMLCVWKVAFLKSGHFCIWSLVIHYHTVIDKANKRITRVFEDYHRWYILYGIIEEPIGIGYLNIHVSGITELQE